jgi:hypothetical protein
MPGPVINVAFHKADQATGSHRRVPDGNNLAFLLAI